MKSLRTCHITNRLNGRRIYSDGIGDMSFGIRTDYDDKMRKERKMWGVITGITAP